MDELRIWLLGGFRVSVDGRDVPDDRWRLRKSRALVAMLALAPGHRLHREQLVDALWPDLPPDSADNQLRKALHEARRCLDPDPAATYRFLVPGERLALRPGTEVDVAAFDDALAVARRGRDPAAYAIALALYGGELLPDERYDAWTREERDRLAAEHVAALVEQARLLEARADLDAAGAALRRVLWLDPLHEEASAALMRVHALAGRRHEALLEYSRLAAALRDELAATPAPATQWLHEQIRAGAVPGSDLDRDLWEQVGDLRARSGDAPGAVAAFERALGEFRGRGPAGRAVRLHRKAAHAWLTDQRADRAEPHLRAAEALARSAPTAERAWLPGLRAAWLWQRGRYGEAQRAAEEGVRLASSCGAAEAADDARDTLAVVLHLRGSWRDGVQAAVERFAPDADSDDRLAQISEIHCCIGQFHLYGDDLAGTVEDYARRTLDLATLRGARRAEAFAWCMLGESLLLQGRFDESEPCLRRAADLASGFGPGSGVLAWQRLAELAACRGDSGTAQACLRRAMAIATVSPLARHTWGRLFGVAALDAVERGDPEAAVVAGRSAAAAAARHGDCGTCSVLLHPVLAEACAALGDEAGTARSAGEARRVAAGFPNAAFAAMAAGAEGALAAVRGDAAGARAQHLRAAALFARAGQPFWTARARWQAATAGPRVDGDLLDVAIAGFERLGALRARDRARQAWRAAALTPSR
ncbi:hypothetical protein OF117_15245 [Geodermatophilus sp. YIM 151500]|uniref:AfsR/SARP family transcriptional regulator n=1 Tax=Geodermatophilus sp. YIM 151500 TaxID=2984531 RepID=UPI0021E42CE3|nr:BTAD domain-containing putative transcriptional regulator [Geodermatophilus sp. YIM 151500]MCV2490714.1 hypothetical protein [Geodermatophilus sp. YIM 151500]